MNADEFDSNTKKHRLSELGIEVWNLPAADENGHLGVDLKALKTRLGAQGIDSIYIEGGGTLNFAALKAGIVDHVCAFIAPKLFGGKDAKTPVEGLGVSSPDEAFMLKNMKLNRLGEDLMFEYDVEHKDI